ncbi:MAG: hypothetical protein HY958_12820 [Bacteroidia bacterium]|nr:hypothetical protein [Bacteroidia bacterium]
MLGVKINNIVETPVNLLTGFYSDKKNEQDFVLNDIMLFKSIIDSFNKIVADLNKHIYCLISTEEAKEIYQNVNPILKQIESVSNFLLTLNTNNEKEKELLKSANTLLKNLNILIYTIEKISYSDDTAKNEHEELKTFILSRKNPAFAKHL